MKDKHIQIKNEIKLLVEFKKIEKHLPDIYSYLQIKDYESCNDYKQLTIILEWAVNWTDENEEFKRFTLISFVNQENYKNVLKDQINQVLSQKKDITDKEKNLLTRKIEESLYLQFGKYSSLHRLLSLFGCRFIHCQNGMNIYVKEDRKSLDYLQFIWTDENQPIWTKTVFTDALIRLWDAWKNGFKKTIEIRKKEGDYTHLWIIKKLKAPRKPFFQIDDKKELEKWKKAIKKLPSTFTIIKQRFNGTALDYADSINFDVPLLEAMEKLIKQLKDIKIKQEEQDKKLIKKLKEQK